LAKRLRRPQALETSASCEERKTGGEGYDDFKGSMKCVDEHSNNGKVKFSAGCVMSGDVSVDYGRLAKLMKNMACSGGCDMDRRCVRTPVEALHSLRRDPPRLVRKSITTGFMIYPRLVDDHGAKRFIYKIDI